MRFLGFLQVTWTPGSAWDGQSFVTFVMWPYRTKDRYISWKLVRTAASYLKNEFGVNFHSHVVIKYRLSWWKWAQLWKYSLQSLPNFWSGQLTKMLYHSSELGTFLLHLVLMEAEEIIILNIKGKNHRRKPFFTLSPPPEVCLCLFFDWKIQTAALKVSLAVSQSLIEIWIVQYVPRPRLGK